MKHKPEETPEIARRKAEAIESLQHECQQILAAIWRGECEAYYDPRLDRVRVFAAGHESLY